MVSSLDLESRIWSERGTKPAAGDEIYRPGYQPIAAYDNFHNWAVTTDIHNLRDQVGNLDDHFLPLSGGTMDEGGNVNMNDNSFFFVDHIGFGSSERIRGTGGAIDILPQSVNEHGVIVRDYREEENTDFGAFRTVGGDRMEFMMMNDSYGDSLVLRSGGDVGIGVTDPQKKLDVDGGIRVGGNINNVNRLSGPSGIVDLDVTNDNTGQKQIRVFGPQDSNDGTIQLVDESNRVIAEFPNNGSEPIQLNQDVRVDGDLAVTGEGPNA